MRPLCVHMDDFCSYRTPTSVDLHDVDYFVLVGPTGSGKSTVIDAICFALYGSVPRWGKENVIKLALAPSANSGRVALVFESAGRRYGVVRALARSSRGTVATKTARLDELDPSVDPADGIEAMLGAQVRSVAEGEGVTAAVEKVTGLEFRYFTQCVVLPQGRFADFLQAEPRKRQDLLVQLLDVGVFEAIMKRAGEEAKAAEARAGSARARLDELDGADEAAEDAAARRLNEVRALEDRVRSALDDLQRTDAEIRERESEAEHARDLLAALTALAMPADVPTLADELRSAADETERLKREVARHERAEGAARERLDALGDKAALALAATAHREHARVTAEIETARADAERARRETDAAEGRAAAARADLEEAERERQRVRDAHTAADLARRLSAGEPCPVCLREVADPPEHHAPPALGAADRDVEARKRDLDEAQAEHRNLERGLSRLEAHLDGLARQLAVQAEHIGAHPEEADVRRRLGAVAEAEAAAAEARRGLRAARDELAGAERRRAELDDRAAEAITKLDAARDTVVALGAPPLDRSDPHAAWTALLAWRDQERGRREQAAGELENDLGALHRRRDGQRGSLAEELAAHDIAAPASVEGVREAVVEARNRAEHRLARVRDDRRLAGRLAEEVRRHERDAAVAHDLARHLRANNFENWLCGEALAVLVETASQTLRELSGGQFEFVLDDRNAIEVADHTEAGLRRSVRTLSGGETFQASLALALALSDQVARFGGGAARSLDSIFLDEGFGTLDPVTLDTVATTLERLTANGDRMVGIVTHVPALAERVPARFDVARDNTGSHLTKKAV
ncbi:AAA family ATPase [Actinomadura chibensis]|uniref:Nuclease SbcCD subunit C n=1 Tax=Actinomadura chibensis TaxID=392828 RepID=A0A5D0NDT1_9ACTN|nr:SMC family ATPase [Actinomadura chibensis]TYB42522.1 SMC family ATPase [Actinomadura chibensis]